jgi:hypothetical protein
MAAGMIPPLFSQPEKTQSPSAMQKRRAGRRIAVNVQHGIAKPWPKRANSTPKPSDSKGTGLIELIHSRVR